MQTNFATLQVGGDRSQSGRCDSSGMHASGTPRVYSPRRTTISSPMSYSVQQVDEDYYGRKQTKPKGKVLKQHVDTTKINLPILKVWLEEEMQKHLPDDDIAVELIYEMLEGNREPSASEIQEQLVTFLGEDDGRAFCSQLWQLLISGQRDKDGIPEELLEKRQQQIAKQTRNQAKAMIEQMRPRGTLEKRRYERTPESAEGPREWQRRRSDRRSGEYGQVRDRKEHSPDKSEGNGKKTNYNRSTRGTFDRDGSSYRRDLSTLM